MSDALSEIAQLLYGAALDETLWAKAGEKTNRLLGGVGGLFAIVDTHCNAMVKAATFFPHVAADEVRERYLLTGWARLDPQVPQVVGARSPIVYDDTEHVDESQEATRAYLDFQARTVGSRHHLTIACAPTPSTRAAYAFHRTRAQGPATWEHRELVSRLLPHFEGAVILATRYSEALLGTFWSGLAGHDPRALLLVDSQRRVLKLSAEAEHWLIRSSAARICNGVLEFPLDNGRIGRRVDEALHPTTPVPRAVHLPSRDGSEPAIAVVFPVVGPVRAQLFGRAAALIRILEPGRAPTDSLARLRDLGLTPREAELAAALANGSSIDAFAEQRALSRETVRTYLKTIFGKLGVSRQSDLVRLVLALT